MLERQGVRIVVPGSLPVAEQIAIFRAARLVIGLHGAGMSNIAFCQPRSFVYELLADNYLNTCFNRLAQSIGLNYFADQFPGQGEGTLHQQTWRIDLDIVASRLDAIRARIAATPRVEVRDRLPEAHADRAAGRNGAAGPNGEATGRSKRTPAQGWSARPVDAGVRSIGFPPR